MYQFSPTEEVLERYWDNNGGNAEVDEIYDEERDSGDEGHQDLVTPANVEEIVAKTEDGDRLEGHNGGKVRGKLVKWQRHQQHVYSTRSLAGFYSPCRAETCAKSGLG